jgi:outer membrane protein assembly factor BamB
MVLFVLAGNVFAADWPMFRGPDRNGLSSETNTPLNWSKDKNIKWKAALPMGGNSSPTVYGDRVFVTCAQDKKGTQRSLYCFDRNSGKELWHQAVDFGKAEPTHDTNPYCASSPAADGQRVIVWHGSAGVFAYDFDGKPLWKRDLGTFKHIWGYAASPVIMGEAVYMNCGPGDNTFVLALNRATGEVIWKTVEKGGADDKSPKTGSWVGTWSTPIVQKVDGRELVIVNQINTLKGFDAKTGELAWWCDGLGPLSYTDPLVGNGLIVGMSGYGGAAIGVKLAGSGDVTAANRLWRAEGNPQRIGSGIVIGDHIYMSNEPEISCIEMATGKVTWKQKFAGSNFWSPMTGTKDRLYITSTGGTTYVISPDPKEFKLLAKNELNERCNAAIAISNGQLFIRTWQNLYCVEEK